MTRSFAGLMVLFLVSGCVEPVREDRAADWARDGDTVAFQHEKEGVFVADKRGNKLAKIFQPDESVLATGRPLYSPVDGRLIFTTAHDLDPQPPQNSHQPIAPGPGPSDGNVFWQRPVKYTCWLRAEAAGDDEPVPIELFTARCEHIGYIAAGLAVRWHPDGQRVLYLDSTPNSLNQHGIYEFDLRTDQTRCVFPHQADAVIFDFTPRGSQLVCVTGAVPLNGGDGRRSSSAMGIWVGQLDDEKSWWRVLDSDQPAAGELPSLTEALRATRPAWTADDAQFAFVTHKPGARPEDPGKSLLHLATVATKTTQTIHELEGKLADLYWSPDGQTLGFVEQPLTGNNLLRFYTADGVLTEPVNRRPVRKFAGFDSTGAHVAYVVPDESGLLDPSQQWALLLIPNRLARDRVILAPAREVAAETEIFSGMRVTFPVWSPTENRLSLWITFVPRYQSLLSVLRRWGLLPGDPAATLDLDTGEVSWIAVTPAEELQVGHYCLLKRDYAHAWEWYERANAKLPLREPPRTFQEFTQALGAPERSQFFEYFCLKQLGRKDDAKARLHDFESTFFPADLVDRQTPAGDPIGPAIMADIVRQLGSEAPLILRLIHDLYISEIFLSVDAPEAGIAFFREQLQSDDDDTNHLSREIALAQLLLIADRREEYLAFCPEFLKRLEVVLPDFPSKDGTPRSINLSQGLGAHASLACLLPLFRSAFLSGIPEESLREAIQRWDASPSEVTTVSDASISLFLRAAHQTLGNTEKAKLIETRLAKASAGKIAVGEKSIDEQVRELFSLFNAIGPFAGASRGAPSSRP